MVRFLIIFLLLFALVVTAADPVTIRIHNNTIYNFSGTYFVDSFWIKKSDGSIGHRGVCATTSTGNLNAGGVVTFTDTCGLPQDDPSWTSPYYTFTYTLGGVVSPVQVANGVFEGGSCDFYVSASGGCVTNLFWMVSNHDAVMKSVYAADKADGIYGNITTLQPGATNVPVYLYGVPCSHVANAALYVWAGGYQPSIFGEGSPTDNGQDQQFPGSQGAGTGTGSGGSGGGTPTPVDNTGSSQGSYNPTNTPPIIWQTNINLTDNQQGFDAIYDAVTKSSTLNHNDNIISQSKQDQEIQGILNASNLMKQLSDARFSSSNAVTANMFYLSNSAKANMLTLSNVMGGVFTNTQPMHGDLASIASLLTNLNSQYAGTTTNVLGQQIAWMSNSYGLFGKLFTNSDDMGVLQSNWFAWETNHPPTNFAINFPSNMPIFLSNFVFLTNNFSFSNLVSGGTNIFDFNAASNVWVMNQPDWFTNIPDTNNYAGLGGDYSFTNEFLGITNYAGADTASQGGSEYHSVETAWHDFFSDIVAPEIPADSLPEMTLEFYGQTLDLNPTHYDGFNQIALMARNFFTWLLAVLYLYKVTADSMWAIQVMNTMRGTSTNVDTNRRLIKN